MLRCGTCRTSNADAYEKVNNDCGLLAILKILNRRRQYDPKNEFFCSKCITKGKTRQKLTDGIERNASSLTLSTSKSSDSSTVSSKDEFMAETRRTFTERQPFSGSKPCPKRFKPETIEKNSGDQDEAPNMSSKETSTGHGHAKSKEPDNLSNPSSIDQISSSNEDEDEFGLLAPTSPNISLSTDRNEECGTQEKDQTKNESYSKQRRRVIAEKTRTQPDRGKRKLDNRSTRLAPTKRNVFLSSDRDEECGAQETDQAKRESIPKESRRMLAKKTRTQPDRGKRKRDNRLTRLEPTKRNMFLSSDRDEECGAQETDQSKRESSPKEIRRILAKKTHTQREQGPTEDANRSTGRAAGSKKGRPSSGRKKKASIEKKRKQPYLLQKKFEIVVTIIQV